MKKIISMILIISLLFSLTSVALSAYDTIITHKNYAEIIDEKVKNENFFVKFIAKLVILGVKMRFISIDKLNEWYNLPSSETEPLPTVPPELPTLEEEPISDNVLKLHSSQSLPYTSNGITITDIKVTKEIFEGVREVDGITQVQKYKYNVQITGKAVNPDSCRYCSVELQFLSDSKDGSELRYYPLKEDSSRNIDSTIKIDENGNFEFECYQYNMFFDYSTYHISRIEYMP